MKEDEPDKMSEHWPATYRGRVPVRVRMAQDLGPDMWKVLRPDTPRIWVHKDDELPVVCNQHGALSVVTPYGNLGVKPHEHDIIEWRDTRKAAQCAAAFKPLALAAAELFAATLANDPALTQPREGNMSEKEKATATPTPLEKRYTVLGMPGCCGSCAHLFISSVDDPCRTCRWEKATQTFTCYIEAGT